MHCGPDVMGFDDCGESIFLFIRSRAKFNGPSDVRGAKFVMSCGFNEEKFIPFEQSICSFSNLVMNYGRIMSGGGNSVEAGGDVTSFYIFALVRPKFMQLCNHMQLSHLLSMPMQWMFKPGQESAKSN